MKTNETQDHYSSEDWHDEKLQICLESAYNNLLRLRASNPDKTKLIPAQPKTGKEMLDRAKALHALSKHKSMMVIAVESYAEDSDSELGKLLLEAMSEDK